jgi:hypothetical protein
MRTVEKMFDVVALSCGVPNFNYIMYDATIPNYSIILFFRSQSIVSSIIEEVKKVYAIKLYISLLLPLM